MTRIIGLIIVIGVGIAVPIMGAVLLVMFGIGLLVD